jgi:hypothetical protein
MKTLHAFFLATALSLLASALAQAPANLNGRWQGSYVCPQGRTGLYLDLNQGAGNSYSAVFSFFALKDNPGVPKGSFTMSGTVNDAGVLRLQAGQWIEQPADYITVNLSAVVLAKNSRMIGQILSPGCSTLSLTKQR